MREASTLGAVGVVLAAGTGTRVGADGNKAYLRLGGRSMVSWSLASVAAVPDIARTVLVIRRGERDLAERTLQDEVPAARVELVEGGDSRHASEFNVLQYLASDIESIYLMASPLYSFLSSSGVKEIATFGGDVSDLVPEPVARRLKEALAR